MVRTYREGHLFLRDSKTGPRTVSLSEPARDVLDGIDCKGPWNFGAAGTDRPVSASWLNCFWIQVRAEAGLHAVRRHDLRHSYANLALTAGP